jgi:hypothetical protein
LLLASAAHAGQLGIVEHGLKDAMRAGQITVGTVKDTRKGEILVDVKRVFLQRGSARPTVGESAWLKLYAGVEWTDPNKSPIEPRLHGGRRSAKVGEEIVAVPAMLGESVEILDADPATLGTLELLFAADPKRELATRNDTQLEALLKSADTGELALTELVRRGRLRPPAIAEADVLVLAAHWKTLGSAARAKLVADNTQVLAADHKARDRMLSVAETPLVADNLPALAKLVPLYDAKTIEDARRLDDLVDQLAQLARAQKVDLSPFADLVLGFELRRPDYKREDKNLPDLTARFDAAAKEKLAAGLLRGAYTSSRVLGNEPDAFLVGEAVRLAGEAPGQSLLAALSTLDPLGRRWVMDAIVDVGVALAKAHPQLVPSVRDLFDRWFDAGAVASDEARDRAKAAVGPLKKKPPVAVSFDMKPGQLRRLSSGERLRFTPASDGFSLSWNGDDNLTYSFTKKEDWYREWYVAPYFVISHRIGDDTLGIKVMPEAEPKPVPQPELLDRAKKISARRGCPDYISDEYDAARGRFEYKSQGPGGRQCVLLFGVRTRNLVRFVP